MEENRCIDIEIIRYFIKKGSLYQEKDAIYLYDSCEVDEMLAEKKRLINFLEEKKGIDMETIKYLIRNGLLHQEKAIYLYELCELCKSV